MKYSMPCLALAVVLSFVAPARAALIFDYSDKTAGNLASPSATFQAVGHADDLIAASSFNSVPPMTPSNLFVKRDGGSESGLGLTNDSPDHEITQNNYIRVDFSGLEAHLASLGQMLTSITFQVGSVQGGEGFKFVDLKDSTTPISGGTMVTGPFTKVPGFDIYTYTVGAADLARYNNFALTATDGNVLLGTITATTGAAVPEPSSFALMGIAGTIGLVVRRVRKGRVA